MYKNEFHTECYLDYINVPKYRISITKLEPALMTWKFNMDDIHDPEPTQTKDCVLGVSRLKTKNVLSLSAKLILMHGKTYT